MQLASDVGPIRANRRVLAAAMVGSTIEHYDFFIFATAAVLVGVGLRVRLRIGDESGVHSRRHHRRGADPAARPAAKRIGPSGYDRAAQPNGNHHPHRHAQWPGQTFLRQEPDYGP